MISRLESAVVEAEGFLSYQIWEVHELPSEYIYRTSIGQDSHTDHVTREGDQTGVDENRLHESYSIKMEWHVTYRGVGMNKECKRPLVIWLRICQRLVYK